MHSGKSDMELVKNIKQKKCLVASPNPAGITTSHCPLPHKMNDVANEGSWASQMRVQIERPLSLLHYRMLLYFLIACA